MVEFEGIYDGRAQSYGRPIFVPQVVIPTSHYLEVLDLLSVGLNPPNTSRKLATAIAVKLAKYLAEQGISFDLSPGVEAEGQVEIDQTIVYDPYTESILAEVESSQQTESKLESAPRFIRPKKNKRLFR
jgi:hypothetical protein